MDKIVTKKLLFRILTKTKNSPIKLEVQGKLTFAKVKKKKYIEKKGIVHAKPL